MICPKVSDSKATIGPMVPIRANKISHGIARALANIALPRSPDKRLQKRRGQGTDRILQPQSGREFLPLRRQIQNHAPSGHILIYYLNFYCPAI
jgi:hypothetical protein